jgi:hypothetical protein
MVSIPILRGVQKVMRLPLLDDAKHWRGRAEEARTLADKLPDCFASLQTMNG